MSPGQPATMPPAPSVHGTKVVVIGANRGLGATITRSLRRSGASVLGTRRSPETEDEHYVCLDVTDRESVRAGIARAVDRLGGLDGLVINAGVSVDGPLHELTPEAVEVMLATNVTGSLAAYQEAVPHLRESQRCPSIVFISSVMAEGGAIGAGLYAATKAAINAMVRTGSAELGRYGIRVNAVAPGFLTTGMGEAVMANERVYEHYRKRIALREFGDPDGVGATVAFLLSAGSAYTTGAVFPVDGGARP